MKSWPSKLPRSDMQAARSKMPSSNCGISIWARQAMSAGMHWSELPQTLSGIRAGALRHRRAFVGRCPAPLHCRTLLIRFVPQSKFLDQARNFPGLICFILVGRERMTSIDVRYWRKADIGPSRAEWPLLTQSGHSPATAIRLFQIRVAAD